MDNGGGWHFVYLLPAHRCLPLLDPGDNDDHNMWNPMLGLLCHVQAGALKDSYLDEDVLVRIAFSCHFSLDPLSDKADVHRAEARHGANAPKCEPPQVLLHGREASGSA